MKPTLKAELILIFKKIRRLYYLTFKRDYVLQQIKKRKGVCGYHGCCSYSILTKFIARHILRCLDKDNKTCKRWDNLPFYCRACPIDEKDKSPYIKDICNFWWEE